MLVNCPAIQLSTIVFVRHAGGRHCRGVAALPGGNPIAEDESWVRVDGRSLAGGGFEGAPLRTAAVRGPSAHGLDPWAHAGGTPRGPDALIGRFGVDRQCARGSGRSWKWTASGLDRVSGVAPGAPGAGASMPSMCTGVRLPEVAHRPRPFQPAFGSSMRPSIPLAKKPIG